MVKKKVREKGEGAPIIQAAFFAPVEGLDFRELFQAQFY